MPPKYKYFTDEEMKGVNPETGAKADMARHAAGIPFIVTDAFRQPGFQDPNAVKNSAHFTGHALDVDCNTSRELFLMLRGLYVGQFRRIGVYFKPDPRGKGLLLPTHLHFDDDETKTQDVMFCSMEG